MCLCCKCKYLIGSLKLVKIYTTLSKKVKEVTINMLYVLSIGQ